MKKGQKPKGSIQRPPEKVEILKTPSLHLKGGVLTSLEQGKGLGVCCDIGDLGIGWGRNANN